MGLDMADEDSGLHPAHLYAFEECGFLVTDANRHLFDDDDLAEWDRAVETWLEAHPEGNEGA